jgi:hypothetical protein
VQRGYRANFDAPEQTDTDVGSRGDR